MVFQVAGRNGHTLHPSLQTLPTLNLSPEMSQDSIERDSSEIDKATPSEQMTVELIVPLPNPSASVKDSESGLSQTEVTSGFKTAGQKKLANVQFVSLCWTLFLIGWNDASTGPLLPRIGQVYHVCSCQVYYQSVVVLTQDLGWFRSCFSDLRACMCRKSHLFLLDDPSH